MWTEGHRTARDDTRERERTQLFGLALLSCMCSKFGKRPSYQDATTSQVRLFLGAKRPVAALVVALARLIPLRSVAALATVTITRLSM